MQASGGTWIAHGSGDADKFTVDNLDYVRRDAYLTGVAAGPIDVERLRRYTFIGSDGLTLFEPGLVALNTGALGPAPRVLAG